MSLPQARGQSQRPSEQNPRIHPDLYNNNTSDGQCPECGVPLDTVDVREHATGHYGYDDLPKHHDNLLARQRQALLLGEPLPEY